MDDKIYVTQKEISEDVANKIMTPERESKRSYNISRKITMIIGIALGIAAIVKPIVIIYILLAFVLFTLMMVIGSIIVRKIKLTQLKQASFDVTTEMFSHNVWENYIIKRRRQPNEVVDNYDLVFENGKKFRLPQVNYKWLGDRAISDKNLVESSHRGDTFIVVTEMKSGKIYAVYNTSIFDYKE